MDGEEKVISPLMRVTLLTESEAEKYRELPTGITQDANVIRHVAECNGKKRVLEITSSGYEITQVDM